MTTTAEVRGPHHGETARGAGAEVVSVHLPIRTSEHGIPQVSQHEAHGPQRLTGGRVCI